MSESKQNVVKENDLKLALKNLYNVSEESIQSLEWSENKGSAADDGLMGQLVAVRGTAEVNNKIKKFSFMVKLTPETDSKAALVKEVCKMYYLDICMLCC